MVLVLAKREGAGRRGEVAGSGQALPPTAKNADEPKFFSKFSDTSPPPRPAPR